MPRSAIELEVGAEAYSWSTDAKIMLELALNVLALSDIMHSGVPRRLMKRLNARTNASAVKSSTDSRWTALVLVQVNKQRYTLDCSLANPRTNRGPAKSTPVTWNGRSPVIRPFGSGGGITEGKGRPSTRLQVTHWWSSRLMNWRPWGIQYSCLTSVSVSRTPLWNTEAWAASTISTVRRSALGRRMGHWVA